MDGDWQKANEPYEMLRWYCNLQQNQTRTKTISVPKRDRWKFEVIRRDLLIQEKTPSVESAYPAVRREAARLQILKPTTSSEENTSLEEVEISLIARNRPLELGQGWSLQETAERRPSQWDKEDKSHLHCTHYGMKKHTKETCFKILGYPEWWEDFKQKNLKVATVVGILQTTSNCNGDTRREEEAKP